MQWLQKHIAKLKAATPERVEQEILNILRDNEAEIVDMNIAQLDEGLNNNGEPLGEYRNENYAAMKRQLNPKANGRVDLELEGDFKAGMYLDAEQFPVEINSTDLKTGKLTEQYDHAFGVTEENQKIINKEIVEPRLIEWHKKLFSIR